MTTQNQIGKIKIFVDGNLIEQAKKGNRLAVSELAGLAAAHIRQMSALCTSGNDELSDFIVQALNEIALSATPNQAFRWSKQGKQPQNNAFLEWHLAQYVTDILPMVDKSVAKSLEIVGKAANMDGRKGGVIEKAYKRYKDGELPDNLFPISPSTNKKVKQIDKRLAVAIEKLKEK